MLSIIISSEAPLLIFPGSLLLSFIIKQCFWWSIIKSSSSSICKSSLQSLKSFWFWFWFSLSLLCSFSFSFVFPFVSLLIYLKFNKCFIFVIVTPWEAINFVFLKATGSLWNEPFLLHLILDSSEQIASFSVRQIIALNYIRLDYIIPHYIISNHFT